MSAAASMGHTNATHQRQYGKWIDQESLKKKENSSIRVLS